MEKPTKPIVQKKIKAQKNTTSKHRTYLSQADIPGCSLEEALRIPRAIIDNYASKPSTPLQVALALKMKTSSGSFRMLCGASIAYGLTKGGYNAGEISLEPIAKRIIEPIEEGDDNKAKREAFLKPKLVGEFLRKYNKSKIPREDIAKNVLKDMGVPAHRLDDVLKMIMKEGQKYGLIIENKGAYCVDIGGIILPQTNRPPEKGGKEEQQAIPPGIDTNIPLKVDENVPPNIDLSRKKKVFITHGKNVTLIEPIKQFLAFGELEPIVATERASVAQPISDKVLKDMRGCGASIIHIDDEMKLIDLDGKSHNIINPNVLIEIGVSMALYGKRYIFLVKEGVELPSDLHGLFQVRYKGETLSSDETMKLLGAIKDMKNHPLPEEQSESKK